MHGKNGLHLLLIAALLAAFLFVSPLTQPQEVYAAGTVTDCSTFGLTSTAVPFPVGTAVTIAPGTLADALYDPIPANAAGPYNDRYGLDYVGGDITFACSGSIRLPQGWRIFVDDLGNSGSTTINAAGNVVTLRGFGNNIFYIDRANVTLIGLTLQEGQASAGGAIYNTFGNLAAREVTLINTTITNNRGNRGAGIYNVSGSTTTLINSTVYGNTTIGGDHQGAGIYNGSGTVNVINTTITGNTANTAGGGVYNNAGTLNIKNSIIAGNSATNAPDCSGAVVSQGYNLVGDATGCTGLAATDLTGVAANLGAAAYNGGVTMNFEPQTGSPAIDGVAAGFCTQTGDQRGQTRPQDGNGDGTPLCDIGSVEVVGTTLPSLSISDVTVAEGNTGTVTAAFTVTRTGDLSGTSSVQYATANNTATAPADYVAIPLTTLNFAPTVATQTINVTVNGDSVDEANETFFVNLSNPTNAVIADPQGVGTITDDDTLGITVTPTTGLVTTEAGGTATFTIRLNSAPSANVTIGLTSSDMTEGTVAPASVTFTTANWATAQTVTVTGVDDALADGNIAYTIATAAATSTDLSYNGLNAPDVAVTNTDNDTVGITVTPTTGLVTTEAGGTATFTIRLNSAPSANVTIGLSSSDTTEGTVAPTSVVFSTTNWATPQTVTVTGVDDPDLDGDIAYTIATAPAVSTDTNYGGLNAADVAVTNADNDTPGITVNPTAGLTTTEAGGTATFTVVLNTAPADTVTIGLTSSDTTEGTVSPASVTFNAGNFATPQTVTVTGVDDPDVDGDIAYTIATAPAVSTDANYDGLDAADVAVTNLDNETSGGGSIIVTPTALTISEPDGSATFVITLATAPTADVNVGLVSSALDECIVSPASATLHAGNWNTGVVVTVTAVDDTLADGSQPCTILTAPASSTDPSYNLVDPADVRVTVRDNEAPAAYVPTAEDHARAQAPLCSLYGGGTNVIVRADVPAGTIWGGSVFCRVIAQNGSFVTDAGQIGNAAVLQQGVIQAVDVFGLGHNGISTTAFNNSVKVCLQGTGAFIYLDATQQPRFPSQLPTTVEGGYTCAYIPNAGTVVLVPGVAGSSAPTGVEASQPAAPAAPSGVPQALTGCMVTVNNILNLRAEPGLNGAVITKVPYNVQLTAFARQGDWFQVDYLGTVGWLSAGFVTPDGACGQ